jgi:hypothetical protein
VMTSNLARRIVPGETVIFAGAGLGLHRRSVVCQGCRPTQTQGTDIAFLDQVKDLPRA